jgi:hypothetical protein
MERKLIPAALIALTLVLSTFSWRSNAWTATHMRKSSAVTCTATPAWVQMKENRVLTNNSASTTGTFGANPASGNTIICAVDYNSNSITVSTVTDNKGNTYAKAAGPAVQTGWQSELWYAVNITGGSSFTVSSTFTGNTDQKIMNCHEYSGVGSFQQGTTATSTNATAVSVGPMSSSTPSELIAGYVSPMGGSLTAGSGFNSRSTYFGNLFEDKVVGTGNQSLTASNSTTDGWYAIAATFKCK